MFKTKLIWDQQIMSNYWQLIVIVLIIGDHWYMYLDNNVIHSCFFLYFFFIQLVTIIWFRLNMRRFVRNVLIEINGFGRRCTMLRSIAKELFMAVATVCDRKETRCIAKEHFYMNRERYDPFFKPMVTAKRIWRESSTTSCSSTANCVFFFQDNDLPEATGPR